MTRPAAARSATAFALRSLAVLTLSLSQELATAAGSDAPPVAAKFACEVDASLYDQRDIQCPLKASAATQRFRFKASFSGGHDDTMASIKTSLNDAPLLCDEGSKTSLMGEDGDVSLVCRFSLTPKAGGTQTLRVKVAWSHAQYTDFEFGPD